MKSKKKVNFVLALYHQTTDWLLTSRHPQHSAMKKISLNLNDLSDPEDLESNMLICINNNCSNYIESVMVVFAYV